MFLGSLLMRLPAFRAFVRVCCTVTTEMNLFAGTFVNYCKVFAEVFLIFDNNLLLICLGMNGPARP